MGSDESSRRDEGDEALDRNEGGGDEGVDSTVEGLWRISGVSSCSLEDTCVQKPSASARSPKWGAIIIMARCRDVLTLSYLCELIMRLTEALWCQSVGNREYEVKYSNR